MSLSDIAGLIPVIIFWILLFVLTFLFFTRSARVPSEAQEEYDREHEGNVASEEGEAADDGAQDRSQQHAAAH